MNNNLRPFIISLLLFGLLALAVINAGIMLANENNASESISNDSAISDYANSLEDTLSDASNDASRAEASFSNSSVSTTGGVVFLDTLGGLWKTVVAAPNALFSLSAAFIKNKLLADPAFYPVFGVIALIGIVTLIFGVWKLLSTGEGG